MLALLLDNFRQNLDTKGEFKVITKKEMLDTFAENLEKERIKLGYTQCEFAKKLGISASSYRNIISRRVDTFILALNIFLFLFAAMNGIKEKRTEPKILYWSAAALTALAIMDGF